MYVQFIDNPAAAGRTGGRTADRSVGRSADRSVARGEHVEDVDEQRDEVRVQLDARDDVVVGAHPRHDLHTPPSHTQREKRHSVRGTRKW